MGLFTPIYMKKKLNNAQWNKACAKVRSLTDAEKLTMIALNAPSETIRKTAVEALNDPGALARIAKEDDGSQSRVVEAAVKRLIDLGDRDALHRAAMESSAGWRVLDSIDDESQLAEIARKAKSAVTRAGAVCKVKDRAVLIAAASDVDGWVRRNAVAKTDDRETLVHAALEDADGRVREAAVKNPALDDPAVLAKVAFEDRERAVRQAAVGRPELIDQAVLARLALEGDSPGTRALAIKKLDDVSVLLKAIESNRRSDGGWGYTGWSAALRLSEIAPDSAIELLVKMMKSDRYSKDEFRKACMVRAAAFLEKRYAETVDSNVRSAIAALPSDHYGEYRSDSNSCSHSDQIAHFDLRV